jgi:hypothetical protein
LGGALLRPIGFATDAALTQIIMTHLDEAADVPRLVIVCAVWSDRLR